MYKLLILFSFPLIAVLSCNTTEPPLPTPKITLAIEDVSCTEAWLNLKTINASLPAKVIIQSNNQNLKEFNLIIPDSTIYLDSLLPNKSYLFKAILVQYSKSFASENVSAVTMDTTSRNFTWYKFEFGTNTSNYLTDVAIIDEDNIWVGGKIYQTDSIGQIDPQPYNAVHWNGNEWEILRIPARTITGDISSAPIRTIYAFNKDDIWTYSDAGSYSHWDGKVWNTEYMNETTIKGGGNKFWGTSSSDLYMACTRGGLSHYNGTKWSYINTGTDLDLNDIYGSWNAKTNHYDIMAVASNHLESFDRQILNISGLTVSHLNYNSINYPLNGIWFKPDRKYYVVGAGIYEKNNLMGNIWENYILEFTKYYTYSIRGNDINDLFVVGSFGEILHFNGMNWKSFINETWINGNLYSVAMKGNLVVAVGEGSTKGIIFIGQR